MHEILRIVHALLRMDKLYEDPNIGYERLFVKHDAPCWLRILEKYEFLPQLATKSSGPNRELRRHIPHSDSPVAADTNGASRRPNDALGA